jgi:hypothetical protein
MASQKEKARAVVGKAWTQLIAILDKAKNVPYSERTPEEQEEITAIHRAIEELSLISIDTLK